MGRVMLIRTIRNSVRATGVAVPGLRLIKDFVDMEFELARLGVGDDMDSLTASNVIARGVGFFVKIGK